MFKSIERTVAVSSKVSGYVLVVLQRVLETGHNKSDDMGDGMKGMQKLSNKLFCICGEHVLVCKWGCQ